VVSAALAQQANDAGGAIVVITAPTARMAWVLVLVTLRRLGSFSKRFPLNCVLVQRYRLGMEEFAFSHQDPTEDAPAPLPEDKAQDKGAPEVVSPKLSAFLARMDEELRER